MDDDDAQFLVVELAAGVNCQDLSETLGTQPFEHANYQWLVLGSTPAGNAVVAAVAGAEVAPEPTKRLAGWLQERLKAAGAAHGVAPYRMTGEAAPAPAPVQPAQRRPAPVQPAQRRARVAPAEAYRRRARRGGRAGAAGRAGAHPRWAVPPPPPPSRILERPPTRGKGRQMAADFPPPPPASQPSESRRARAAAAAALPETCRATEEAPFDLSRNDGSTTTFEDAAGAATPPGAAAAAAAPRAHVNRSGEADEPPRRRFTKAALREADVKPVEQFLAERAASPRACSSGDPRPSHRLRSGRRHRPRGRRRPSTMS